MRIPLLYADFDRGAYTKVAKALRKIWPLKPLSLMQSQDSLAILLGYNGHFAARREAIASFMHPPGSIGVKDANGAVVRRMFLQFGIDPLAARALVPKLHLNELAFATDSRVGDILRVIEAAFAQGSDVSETSDGSTSRMFVDEAGLLLGSMAEPMKERLRAVEGVPNATYQVRDDRVFVFENLVMHVDALGLRPTDADLPELARKLVEHATTTPEEAVNRWKIVPAPYEVEEIAHGAIAIRHKPFNARVPGVYNSRDEAQAALVRLLMGGVVPGIGEFDYLGQPMSLCAPMDLHRFTMSAPDVRGGAPVAYRWALNGVEWRAGFAPVSEAFFVQAKDICARWAAAGEAMGTWVARNIAGIWSRVGELHLDALNDPLDDIPAFEREQLAALRQCYPELTMLSDGTLWSVYDQYQMVCWQANSWDASRDDDLIFFMMGCLTDPSVDGYAGMSLGRWTLYDWAHGSSVESAKDFGREIRHNVDLASSIGYRIADAMQFLQRREQGGNLRGESISTFGDLFRVGRKRSALPVLMQSPAQPHGPARRKRR